MAILTGVRNQLELSGQPIRGRDLALVINLERYVINSVNIALDDRSRGTSDHLLCVVALCAAYEVKHGEPQRYHTHMQGLLQMIDLRGGLAAIGGLDPYTVRFLSWLDVNMARILGSKDYLQTMMDKEGIQRPKANQTIFRVKPKIDLGGVVEEV